MKHFSLLRYLMVGALAFAGLMADATEPIVMQVNQVPFVEVRPTAFKASWDYAPSSLPDHFILQVNVSDESHNLRNAPFERIVQPDRSHVWVKGLTPGSIAHYRIRPVDADGNEGSWSNQQMTKLLDLVGDYNKDGVIDEHDTEMIVDQMLGRIGSTYPSFNGDLNGDGVIDVGDMQIGFSYDMPGNQPYVDLNIYEMAGKTNLDDLTGIAKTKENIGNWDEGYITPKGYFLYSEDIERLGDNPLTSPIKAPRKDGLIDVATRQLMTFLSGDGSLTASVVFNAADRMPIQVVFDDAVVDFCYLNDTIVEVVLETASGMSLVKTIKYDRASLLASATSLGFSNNLQHALYLLVQLAKGQLAAFPQLEVMIDLFEQLLALNIDTDIDLSSITLNMDMSTGIWRFVVDANDLVISVILRVHFNITLWTGDAKFKLGGSSVTLCGAVYCASRTYNSLGTYGVLIDTNPDNLTFDKADFKVQAHQDPLDLQYEVDFRGFLPKTTYYYRSYYRFNSTNHGALRFKYGDRDAEVGYDYTIKSFTTGENALTVDVVMCMDVTGSMSSEIGMVKNNALTFYDQFKSRCDEKGIILTGLNTQVVQFRDINVDGPMALLQSPTYQLPDQKAAFKTYVDAIYADGGGDTPESGLEALNMAFSKTDWGADDGYHRHVVILWTDAPYLSGAGYTSLTTEGMLAKWNSMPSGRRMILFAPNGTSGSHSSSWANLDGWTNVVHFTDVTRGFSDMGSVLDDIIGELTSRGSAAPAVPAPDCTFFRPNY